MEQKYLLFDFLKVFGWRFRVTLSAQTFLGCLWLLAATCCKMVENWLISPFTRSTT